MIFCAALLLLSAEPAEESPLQRRLSTEQTFAALAAEEPVAEPRRPAAVSALRVAAPLLYLSGIAAAGLIVPTVRGTSPQRTFTTAGAMLGGELLGALTLYALSGLIFGWGFSGEGGKGGDAMEGVVGNVAASALLTVGFVGGGLAGFALAERSNAMPWWGYLAAASSTLLIGVASWVGSYLVEEDLTNDRKWAKVVVACLGSIAAASAGASIASLAAR